MGLCKVQLSYCILRSFNNRFTKDFNIYNHTNWPFYFSLESDVVQLSRYIEFNKDNFDVYSIELVRMYLSICSEVDVVLKEICIKIDSKSKASNINQYRETITKEFECFTQQQILCTKFNFTFKPWSTWEQEESPTWWRHYNNVKHNRNEHYNRATLANVLEALSALYIANLYLVFIEHKKINPTFCFSVSEIVQHAPIQLDFYRITDFLAYRFE